MSCYISSNDNRVYVALESSFGEVPAITGQNRIPLVHLAAQQKPEQTKRIDKTGGRTFPGMPNRLRKLTHFQLSTLMTAWTDQSSAPSQGPLFQAAMGAPPARFGGGTATSASGNQLGFSSAHGLTPGQAVTFGGEIRFVAAVQDGSTVFLNAPFTTSPVAGSPIGTTLTYQLATDLGSCSLFDFWDPSTAVQRIVNGAAMNTMKIKVNGDFQEFEFAGPSQDLLDSASFTSGQGGLTQFPTEPDSTGFDYTVVPGHLGQVWMGTTEMEFHSITAAELVLNNGVDLRVKEFGSDIAHCFAAGVRSVTLQFSLFEHDDDMTKGLYQAARQRSPIGVMLQLGEAQGQLFGAYMPAMVPEVPEFDDHETRLEWKFQNSRAQGTINDELYIAFG